MFDKDSALISNWESLLRPIRPIGLKRHTGGGGVSPPFWLLFGILYTGLRPSLHSVGPLGLEHPN
jgi:hypothetical protein